MPREIDLNDDSEESFSSSSSTNNNSSSSVKKKSRPPLAESLQKLFYEMQVGHSQFAL